MILLLLFCIKPSIHMAIPIIVTPRPEVKSPGLEPDLRNQNAIFSINGQIFQNVGNERYRKAMHPPISSVFLVPSAVLLKWHLSCFLQFEFDIFIRMSDARNIILERRETRNEEDTFCRIGDWVTFGRHGWGGECVDGRHHYFGGIRGGDDEHLQFQ